LIGTSADPQLPTIRSRAQIVRFRPLQVEVVARLALAQGHASTPAEAQKLAEHSQGSLARAAELADAELWTFRRGLFERLAAAPLESMAAAKETLEFVDAAGKQASDRRRRLRQVLGFASDFYRQLVRHRVGLPASGDAELDRTLASARSQRGDAETASACLDRCLEALVQVDRNANQATLVECWFDDLARLAG
jgi:DNA polymerase-3 subunit delta'